MSETENPEENPALKEALAQAAEILARLPTTPEDLNAATAILEPFLPPTHRAVLRGLQDTICSLRTKLAGLERDNGMVSILVNVSKSHATKLDSVVEELTSKGFVLRKKLLAINVLLGECPEGAVERLERVAGVSTVVEDVELQSTKAPIVY